MARFAALDDRFPTAGRGVLTRRTLLASTLATIGTGELFSSVGQLSGRATAAEPAKDEPGRAPTLSLGFGAYALKSFRTEEAIDLVAAAGYDSIELCLLPDFDAAPEKLTAERRQAIRERLAEKSLILSSLMENLVLAVDDAPHQKNLARLNAAFELSHDLGGDEPPLVQTVLGGPAGKWPEVRERFVARLRDWVKAASAAGVTLAVKPHRMNAMSTPAEFVAVAEELGNPASLKMVFDWSHYAYRGLDLDQQLKLARPYLAHVAVKDAIERDGKVEFVLPGAGGPAAGDYVALLQGLIKNGYAGDVSVEVSGQLWRAPGYDPRAALKQSYDFLAAQFTKANIPRKRLKK
ncbi:MAG TPA: sugar phosphate isomerase/epimerase [Pirellulales bacterium]